MIPGRLRAARMHHRARISLGSMSRARFGLRAGVALLSFVILIGSGLAWATYKNFTNNVPHGAPLPASASDPDGKDQNILLVGNDSRAGASKAELAALHTGFIEGTVNTDTMMLLHVPADGRRPTLVSFPRDSWVEIPGYGKSKLNAAYGDAYTSARNAHQSEQQAQSAGLLLVAKTISQLTGLHIDHYVQVNLLGFYRISNAIGGVTVCLNAAQNAQTDSDGTRTGFTGINLPKGVSVIKGVQALAFVRQRHGLPGGDLDRVRRQQYFLASAFHKVTSAGVLLNPFKLHDLLDAVGKSLLTDPSLDLLKLARQFDSIAGGGIRTETIPNNGPQLIYPDGVETSIVQVDTAAMPGFVRRLAGQPADPALAAAKAAAPSSVAVDVLNGTDETGWAKANSDRLKALHFKVQTVDSTENSAQTSQILYPKGGQASAKALAKVVPGAELVLSNQVKRATVVLGLDGKQVSGAQHPGAAKANGAATGTAPGKTTSKTTSKTAKASTSAPASPAGTDGLGCIN